MNVTIPTDVEAFVKARVASAGFGSVDQYVYSLIQQDEAEASFEELTPEELAASLAMLERGMADVAAGRTIPAKVALQEIADEFGLNLER